MRGKNERNFNRTSISFVHFIKSGNNLKTWKKVKGFIEKGGMYESRIIKNFKL